MSCSLKDLKARMKAAYGQYLEECASSYNPKCSTALPKGAQKQQEEAPSTDATIGIVGGGMGGLYAALLLQQHGYTNVKIFEQEESRVGGRVFTHHFDQEGDPKKANAGDRHTYQYFEAGAMRFPDVQYQQSVFDLIKWLNPQLSQDKQIKLIDFPLSNDGENFTYVNGVVNKDGTLVTVAQSNKDPQMLRFPKDYTKQPGTDFMAVTPTALLVGDDAAPGPLWKFIGPLQKAAQAPDPEPFNAAFQALLKFDDYSLRTYLAVEEKWTEAQINYCECLLSQTNQFQNSFTELCIELTDFGTNTWKTIDAGMDHLPNGCRDVVGADRIHLGSRVTAITEEDQGKKTALHFQDGRPPMKFDKVIMALPPAALRLIKVPQWSVQKLSAIRGTHFEQLAKIGLQFHTRFWEQDLAHVQKVLRELNCGHFNPKADPNRYKKSFGGQSTTDLPTRWFVYPPFDLGAKGPGTMMLYSWMTDAAYLGMVDDSTLIAAAKRDLQTVYGDGVCIDCLLIKHFTQLWANAWPGGDALFFPGQFKNYLGPMREPEGNVYFVGEHLSLHHTWIAGALESAKIAVGQILGRDVPFLGAPK